MIPLNQIQVAKPCGENWDAMDGDARRRFCAGCGCHVHDLSAMTRIQAQALLDQNEGRVCVRFQTLPDGTVMTQETAVSSERRVFWPRRLAAAASWVMALALTGLGLTAQAETISHKTSHLKPKSHVAPSIPRRPSVTLGKIAIPQHTLGQMTIVRPKPPTTKPPTTTQHPTTMGAPVVPAPQPPTMGLVALPPKK
jgi:hypothetical protein